MLRICAAACGGKRAIAPALAVGALGVLAPRIALAFQLVAPAPWVVEDQNGDPQTIGPCGADLSVCYTPSGAVTTFTAGQEITVNWVETVPSDGWFRIALSTHNRTDLSSPAVSVNGAGLSIDADIAPPTDPDAAPLGITTLALPVLADGLFPHVAADIPGVPYRYSWNLVLPPGVLCDKCTLQVIQFLSNHSDNLADKNPDGYYAHHCADITILPADDAGASPLGPGGTLSIEDAGGPSAACASNEAGGLSEAGGPSEAGGSSDAGGAGGSDSAGGSSGAGEDAGSDAPAGMDEAGANDAGEDGGVGGPSGGGGCGCVAAGTGRASALACLGVVAASGALLRRRRRRAR
jgi:hypothetical protein